MWGISSDLQEAFVEFEAVYRQFQTEPVNDYERFLHRSEVFALSGLKLLMAFTESRNPQSTEPIAVGCENVNYVLTKLRISSEAPLKQDELADLKEFLLSFFELAFGEPSMA